MSEPEDKLDIGALRDRFLECPVCIEHFNLTDRRPRLLHACLHAFCTQCLDQLLEKEGKGQVTCPVCRHVEKVRGNAESLHIDPVREQLVEYLQITHKKEIICDDCPDKNQATSRCVECGDNLCNDCALAHKRNKLTRNHQTATLGELVSETTRKLKIRHYCSAHPERAIECYCENCEKLCCLMCAVTSHKGHDIKDLSDTSKIKMTEIESHLDEIDELWEKLILAKQQCETYAKKLVKERDCSRINIIKEFDKLENLLKKHKMAMLLKVEEETEKLASVARKQGSQYENSLAEIESLKTYFDNAKTRTDEVSFLQAFPSMMKTFQNIASCNDRKMEISSKRVEFKATGINNVQDTINSFGSVTVWDIENVAERVMSKQHKLQGRPLSVKLLQACDSSTLIVTGFSSGINIDFLELYFESPRRSGGGKMKNFEEKHGKIYITYEDPDVADRVLKRGHVLNGETLTVVREGQQPVDEHVEECVKEETVSKDTVEIKGYDTSASDHSIELYFENKRKSGGGNVVKMDRDDKKGVIFITFESEEIANKVASKQHKLAGRVLQVRLCLPLQTYKDKILLSGVPKLVSGEFFVNYLESKIKLEVHRLLYGEEDGNVLVEFSAIIKDFDKVKETLKYKKFKQDGVEFDLEVSQIPQTSSITVHKLPHQATEDTVRLYFENTRKSGGDEIEEVTLHMEENFAVVSFKDPAVADRVTKREHKLLGTDICVCLHFECLGKKGGLLEPPITYISEWINVN